MSNKQTPTNEQWCDLVNRFAVSDSRYLPKYESPPDIELLLSLSVGGDIIRMYANYCLHLAMCIGAELIAKEEQLAVVRKQRDELLGIATCISQDKAEATASPEVKASAESAASDFIKRMQKPEGGAA